MQFGGRYQGSSFVEFLELDHKHLRPDWAAMTRNFDVASIPQGTTVMAFKYADGVVIAGDRLATVGHRVASRDN